MLTHFHKYSLFADPSDITCFIATYAGFLGDSSTAETSLATGPDKTSVLVWSLFGAEGVRLLEDIVDSKTSAQAPQILKTINCLGALGWWLPSRSSSTSC